MTVDREIMRVCVGLLQHNFNLNFFYLVLGNELDCCSDLSLASAGPYFCFCEQYVEAACTLLVQCTGKVTAFLGGLLAMYTRAEHEPTC